MLFTFLIVLCASFVSFVVYAIYNLFFHRLARFPGPVLWRISYIPGLIALFRGELHNKLEAFHAQYGNIVRIGPNDLSAIGPNVWQEMYGHGKSRAFIKHPKNYRRWPGLKADSIMIANESDHSRFRRLLAHAFSDKALAEQQATMDKYITDLIDNLRKHARKGDACNMVRWYNYTTFDLIGDLAFGEPFGCLDSSSYHPWVALILDSIKIVVRSQTFALFVPGWLLWWLAPKEAVKKRMDHLAMTEEKVNKRINLPTERSDFMKYVLRHNDEKGMSKDELVANANVLILAGSETTATALSAITYYLTRHPEKLQQLTRAIREKFENENDIETSALAKMPYLNAVIREGMRLYPPIPIALPRMVAQEDAVVQGKVVPLGTTIGLPQWSAYRSPRHFSDPDEFKPERWLEPESTDELSVFEPFSIGPRNCIGKNLAQREIRLVLARILYNFDLELVDDDWNPRRHKVFIIWDKPALNIKLTARDQ